MDWKPIPGFPGYFATREGHIFSTRRAKKLRLLKPTYSPYASYGLMRSAKAITVHGHRVVASAWLPDFTPQCVVRHLDGNPKNNFVDNLACGTQAENIADKWTHGTMAFGERNGRHTHPESVPRGEEGSGAKLRETQVIEIIQRLKSGERGNALAREFGVLKTTISAIKKGRTWKHLAR